MRHIGLEDLANKIEIQTYEALVADYVNQMSAMTVDERKTFIRDNTPWNALQEIMFNLSESKCWYSEAPPGAGDFEIDHFRPKNRSRQFNGDILIPNGYWWLTYDWRNYRLAGGLVNKRRRDRLGFDEEVKGKGDYFPLNIDGGSVICDFGGNLNNELPILLDPQNVYDVSLLTFDENGEPIIQSDIPAIDKFRVEKSIIFYHLDLEQLSLYRSQIWKKCKDELFDINEAILTSVNEHQRMAILRKACNTLLEITNKRAPFSKVAWACIDANTEKYSSWLKNLKTALIQ
jgi:hypothetical protein